MNKRQENKKSSLESVRDVMEENSAPVAEYPALAEAFTTLNTDVECLDATAQDFNNVMKGKSTTKHDAESDLITFLHPVGRALRSLARKIKDNQLFEIADISESDLEKKRPADLLDHAKTILKKANDNFSALAPYKVTQEELTLLQGKIDAFEKSVKSQGGAMANRSSDTDAIKVNFQKIAEDLEDIDDIMERVREKYPQFYDAYHDARRVKALGIRHRKTLPPVPSASSGEPTKSNK